MNFSLPPPPRLSIQIVETSSPVIHTPYKELLANKKDMYRMKAGETKGK